MSKLIHCDGAELMVHDVSEPLYCVRRRAGGPPIRHHGWRILANDAARELLEELRRADLYDAERL